MRNQVPALAPETEKTVQVDPARLPRHVAIIMDGNGRWAKARGLDRSAGHRNGAGAVRTVVTEAFRLGIEVVTLYSFSVENWRRPENEIAELMRLCALYLDAERETLRRERIRFRHVGSREGLPASVLEGLDRLTRETADCDRGTLCLAINYGSRNEILEATRSLAADAAAGRIDAASIDERAFSDRLHTSGLPDPDLLIRTAGEMRLSNYLLWQLSYAELYVTDTLWPDFGAESLREAVRAFAARDRRFGGLGHAQT